MMSKEAKRYLLVSLSFLVQTSLLFSLFLYYTLPLPKPIDKKKQVKESKKMDDFYTNISDYHGSMLTSILEHNISSKSAEIVKHKPSIKIVTKDKVKQERAKDLRYVGFNERLSVLGAKVGNPVFVRIFKKESMLEVWIKPKHEYVLFKLYPICAFSGHLGPKLKTGDKQAPEGFYKVTKRLLNPNSRFHLAFNLGYPNAYDKSHRRTGSYLMVHGKCASVGCYAMTNAKIEEIYKLVEKALKKGQKYVQVHAFPFRMSSQNMSKHERNRWYDFWTELKVGYDYFESEKLTSTITVKNKHYTIHEAIH
jgi:murein L,D-transpeptidase YafK